MNKLSSSVDARWDGPSAQQCGARLNGLLATYGQACESYLGPQVSASGACFQGHK